MRERKFVKLKVNMYEDTKFKIIDTMKKRGLIQYIWTRLVTLAGKVNLEGNLYLSKNIPYTLETLAIEFNREVGQVKLAINTLIDLEMLEFTQDKIYKVKNFAKHQNIRTKEKLETNNNMEERKNKEEKIAENIEKQLYEEKNTNLEPQTSKNIDEVSVKHVIEDKIINIQSSKREEINNKLNDSKASCKDIKDNKSKNNLQINVQRPLPKKKTTKNEICINDINEIDEEESLIEFFDGEDKRPMREGEKVIMSFSF